MEATSGIHNAAAGRKAVPQDYKREATSVFAGGKKTPVNSTGVRGIGYENSLTELARSFKNCDSFKDSDLALLLDNLSCRLFEYRGAVLHYYRVRVVLTTRCFLDVIKVLLRYDEGARLLWFSDDKVRTQLVTGFASYMADPGTKLDMAGYPEVLRFAFWAALRFVADRFDEAEAGWANVRFAPVLRVKSHFNALWRSANMKAITDTDDLVTEKQESKLVAALLAVVTSESDFQGASMQEFMQHRGDCKKMLSHLVGVRIARFPSKSSDDQGTAEVDDDGDDGDDDEDSRLEREVDAAYRYDEEVAKDPSFVPHEVVEKFVKGDAVLELTDEERQRISRFEAIAGPCGGQFCEFVVCPVSGCRAASSNGNKASHCNLCRLFRVGSAQNQQSPTAWACRAGQLLLFGFSARPSKHFYWRSWWRVSCWPGAFYSCHQLFHCVCQNAQLLRGVSFSSWCRIRFFEFCW